MARWRARRDPANYRQAPDGSRWLAVPITRAIAREYYGAVARLPRPELFALCEALLDSGDDAERTIAFDWAYRRRRDLLPDDFERFDGWLERYVADWGGCDDFCTHAFGCLLYSCPDLQPRTLSWTASPNRWRRRAAAVILLYGLRRGTFLEEAFRIADALLTDPDDMVQKGYGWLLKEASNCNAGQVLAFVLARKDRMPRTALRYAIEKLPPEWHNEAMAQ
ncbi:MAG: DNA alkylation repair protein [Anaerolineae bacterium]|nr:DNA alkylation repair protein [Anaerolineae bacterium]